MSDEATWRPLSAPRQRCAYPQCKNAPTHERTFPPHPYVTILGDTAMTTGEGGTPYCSRHRRTVFGHERDQEAADE